MLTFVQKMAALQPDIVFGDGEERSRDTAEMRKFCRKLAADGIVLLKNTGNVLPITPLKAKTVAVIGPNAKGTVISGGGAPQHSNLPTSSHHSMVSSRTRLVVW